MTQNTSASGGYLAPFGSQPVDDDALDRKMQVLVAGIVGLALNDVRPRWQPVTPTEPALTADWAAIGIHEREADDNATVIHHPEDIVIATGQTSHGYDESIRHERLGVLCSFYGPNSRSNAERLRDGLWIAQNREALLLDGMGLLDVDPAITAPDLINNVWRKRVDVMFHIRRAVTRLYPVENLLAAQGEIKTDTGHVTTWDTEDK